MNVSVRLRALALLPLAALAVHELRFALAPGASSGGHGYLDLVAPAAGFLCALVAAELVARVARGRAGMGQRPRQSWLGLWLVVAAGLIAAYVGQELIEGALCGCRPAGPVAVLGAGGWVALPAALAIGGLLALALRGAEAVVARVAPRARPRRRPVAHASRLAAVAKRLRPAPLASAAAGRAPPRFAPVR
jgi:hypothetical protein